jgi:hypothetical protein
MRSPSVMVEGTSLFDIGTHRDAAGGDVVLAHLGAAAGVGVEATDGDRALGDGVDLVAYRAGATMR